MATTVQVGEAWHYPPELVELASRAVSLLNKGKVSELDFFRGAGVPERLLGHLDHVGAFRKLVQDFGYEVDLVIASPNAKWNTETNQKILNALRNQGGATVKFVKRGDSFSWGGASWKILNPAQGAFTASLSVENSSLVVVLQVNGRRALFTGDIKEAATAQLAANWGSLGRAQVFLVTHHGSGSGSSSDLLKKIQPATSSRRSSHALP